MTTLEMKRKPMKRTGENERNTKEINQKTNAMNQQPKEKCLRNQEIQEMTKKPNDMNKKQQ